MKFDFQSLFESKHRPSKTSNSIEQIPEKNDNQTHPEFLFVNTSSIDANAENNQSISLNYSKVRAVNLSDEKSRANVVQTIIDKINKQNGLGPKTNCIHFSNCVYAGDVANKQAHGFGFCIFDNFDYYIGQFKNNKFDGKGFYYSFKGNYVFAQFTKGQAHGNLFWANHKGECGDSFFENGKLIENSVTTANNSMLKLRSRTPDSQLKTLTKSRNNEQVLSIRPQSVVPRGTSFQNTFNPNFTMETSTKFNISPNNASFIQDTGTFDAIGFLRKSNALFRNLLEQRKITKQNLKSDVKGFISKLENTNDEFIKVPIEYTINVNPQKIFLGNNTTQIGSLFLQIGETIHGKFEQSHLIKIGLMNYLDGMIEFGVLSSALKNAKTTLNGFGKRFYPEIECNVVGFYQNDNLNGNFLVEYISGELFKFVQFENNVIKKEFFKLPGVFDWKYVLNHLFNFLIIEFENNKMEADDKNLSQDFVGKAVGGISKANYQKPEADYRTFYDEIIAYFLDCFCGIIVEPGLVNSRNKIDDYKLIWAAVKPHVTLNYDSGENVSTDKKLEEYFKNIQKMDERKQEETTKPNNNANTEAGFNFSLFESFHDPSLGEKSSTHALNKKNNTGSPSITKFPGSTEELSLKKEKFDFDNQTDKIIKPSVLKSFSKSPPKEQISVKPGQLLAPNSELNKFLADSNRPTQKNTANTFSNTTPAKVLTSENKLDFLNEVFDTKKPSSEIKVHVRTSSPIKLMRSSEIVSSENQQLIVQQTDESKKIPTDFQFLKFLDNNILAENTSSSKPLKLMKDPVLKDETDENDLAKHTSFLGFLKNKNVELIQSKVHANGIDNIQIQQTFESSFPVQTNQEENDIKNDRSKNLVQVNSMYNKSPKRYLDQFTNQASKNPDLAQNSKLKPSFNQLSTKPKIVKNEIEKTKKEENEVKVLAQIPVQKSPNLSNTNVQEKSPVKTDQNTKNQKIENEKNVPQVNKEQILDNSTMILNLSELKDQNPGLYLQLAKLYGIEGKSNQKNEPQILKITPKVENNLSKQKQVEVKSAPPPKKTPEEPIVLNMSDIFAENKVLYDQLAKIYDIPSNEKQPIINSRNETPERQVQKPNGVVVQSKFDRNLNRPSNVLETNDYARDKSPNQTLPENKDIQSNNQVRNSYQQFIQEDNRMPNSNNVFAKALQMTSTNEYQNKTYEKSFSPSTTKNVQFKPEEVNLIPEKELISRPDYSQQVSYSALTQKSRMKSSNLKDSKKQNSINPSEISNKNEPKYSTMSSTQRNA